jgi:hypothetical protein
VFGTITAECTATVPRAFRDDHGGLIVPVLCSTSVANTAASG